MVDRREYLFEGERPTIDPEARVSREAILIGDVTVGADASVWPGAVVRGDVGPVRIGEQSHDRPRERCGRPRHGRTRCGPQRGVGR